MQTLNKGEWSEFYAFIKLLADGRIHYGDEQMNLIMSEYFDIDKVLKTKYGVDQVFYISEKEITSESVSISRESLKQSAKKVFEQISKGKSTFAISEAEDLKTVMNIERFSEPVSAKADIRMSLLDEVMGKSNVYGFSIKSKLTANSTLINSSGHSTGFRYKLEGCNVQIMQEVNKIESRGKVNDRISKILDSGCEICFVEPTSQTYKNNLKMVDTSLDSIIGEILLEAYIENKKKLKEAVKTKGLTDFYTSIDLTEEAVIYKVKNFLNVSAIGMTPSKPWNGESEVDGGLVIVKTSGDLVGYFLFSLNKFKEYLWQNTFFETPSTSRHKFGYVYQEGEDFFFDLNIQVRFK